MPGRESVGATKRFSNGWAPLTRKDFQRLAELRANEAAVLAQNGKQQGAYYLAGMAIECALKARIAKKTRKHEFPRNRKYTEKAYSHELTELLKLAGLDDQLNEDIKRRPALGISWGVVQGWKVDSRYETSGLNGKDMYTAITGPDGVLTWIKQRW